MALDLDTCVHKRITLWNPDPQPPVGWCATHPDWHKIDRNNKEGRYTYMAGSNDQRKKSQRTAAWLLSRGIPHGKRMSSPRPNSGGLTMTMEAGSAKYRRMRDNKKPKQYNTVQGGRK